MTPSESIIAMRKQTGLSQAKFAAIFNIPVATLQDWEHGRRTPPSYVPEMMQTILSYRKTDRVNTKKSGRCL